MCRLPQNQTFSVQLEAFDILELKDTLALRPAAKYLKASDSAVKTFLDVTGVPSILMRRPPPS